MRAKKPFEFNTSSQLIEITGRKAGSLKEFLEIIKQIEDSSIFYHVHHAFREHQFAPRIYSNDFARWIGEKLNENALAEQVANINIKDYTKIKSLREKIVEIIENHLKNDPDGGKLPAKHKFYFCKNISIIRKTKYAAWDLNEFCDILRQVGMRSLFFHFFEARLRLGRKTNDFSDWISYNFNDNKLARRIESLDPYLYTMDQLRDKIISLIRKRQDNFWDTLLKWLKIR